MKEEIGKLTEINAYMVFLAVTMDDQFEVELSVSCGEDLENYMKLYLEQNWKELFENTRYVCDASFHGIQMLARDKENKHSCFVEAMNTRRRASISIDRETLSDNNLDKLNRIKEIINS
ncbi:hypothetical protein ABEX53_29520 [Bacillus toyonensis]|uniref:hypothetical protein n=1 Tax=Bacillus toyonensis TaxID=155322 RepID=UPI000CD9E095|nr:hypothetical protein [Bacillus toyonensis]MED3539313.1 hypothetical protein [Bacillus toyonensis]MEE2022148.1 hypothetical protein [Bacillus toyonensis]QPW49570.1 hypothetical protein G9298_18045 [Bacillus thuringiensis]